MNNNIPTIGELLSHTKLQGLLSDEETQKIAATLDKSEKTSDSPIYIQILAGIGAWFAAVSLVVAIGMSELFYEYRGESAIILGIVFLTTAIVISWIKNNTFLDQISLALAFSGNALILFGVMEFSKWGEFTTAILTHAAICVIIYPLYKNSIYRFLAPIVLVILATCWIFEEEAFFLTHMLIAAQIILLAILLLWKKRPSLLTPLFYSAAIMTPATLIIINLTQMNIWRTDFTEPLWPSSLLITVGLIALYFYMTASSKRFSLPSMILAIIATALLGIFTTPGIIIAISLLIIGRMLGDRFLTIISYLFLVHKKLLILDLVSNALVRLFYFSFFFKGLRSSSRKPIRTLLPELSTLSSPYLAFS